MRLPNRQNLVSIVSAGLIGLGVACGPKPAILVGEVPYGAHKYNVMLDGNEPPKEAWVTENGVEHNFLAKEYIYVKYEDNTITRYLDSELSPANPLYRIFVNSEELEAIITKAQTIYAKNLIWQQTHRGRNE